MKQIVGFTLMKGFREQETAQALAAQERAIARFAGFERQRIVLGDTVLEVWGHPGMGAKVHRQAGGAALALVGSPVGGVAWDEVDEALERARCGSEFRLPWDGRVVLVRVSADGERWELWDDWVGSIPVFYGQKGAGRIASTLEPVVAAGMGAGAEDIYLPALASLLINGHYLSDWSLYRTIKVMRPDSYVVWDGEGYRETRLWTVKPSDERWTAGWDELVDEMYERSRQAILKALREHPVWILPLSSGLDSRLIAAVGAQAGVEMHVYTWGPPHATDVVYAKQIAKALGIPWRRVDIGSDYLVKYTQPWAEWFGTSMHFHGMYQMAFLERLEDAPAGPLVIGLMGDTLAGSGLTVMLAAHTSSSPFIVGRDYAHWYEEELRSLMRVPIQGAIEELEEEIRNEIDSSPFERFQRVKWFEIWSRQRYFTRFSATLSAYWRGVSTPFLDRQYANFCLSLPRAALDDRRLLADVYRRHYGKLAVIPGTYAEEPFIRTGRFLLMRRIAELIPKQYHWGSLRNFDHIPLHMDADSIQACGWEALWPIREVWEELKEWLHVEQLEEAYQAVMRSNEDIRPVRKLQSVQTLAYLLLRNRNSV